MSFNDYWKHYTNPKSMLMYFLLSLAFSVICVFYILMIVSIEARFVPREDRKQFYYLKAHNTIQRFYEMVFSGASILSFLAVYYLINRFLKPCPFKDFWDKYKDLLLLVMICLSCVFNNFLDYMLVPLKKITRKDKASVRLTGMLYVILIFVYIKFIYENNNYDGFIMYFLGLMIGRFIYFDASFKDFLSTVKDALRNLPLLVLGLLYTGFMAYTGFESDYLLVKNGVLVSTFIAHIFMIVAIFVVHHSHFMSLFARKPKTQSYEGGYDERRYDGSDYEEYDDSDYEEYDNREYGDYDERDYEEDEEYYDGNYESRNRIGNR